MFSVVIPGHNEAENLTVLLPRLYPALLSLGQEFEILFVDNASTDDTEKVIQEFQKSMPQLKLVVEPTMGYGRALLAGFAQAKGEYIGTMRSDNQEKPEDLSRMVVLLQEKNYALYKAVRMHRINDGVLRIIVSFVYNLLFKILFRLHSRDLNASPKVFTRDFYERAHLVSTDWFIDAEMVLKAEKMGLPVGEMNIEYLPRLRGTSTVRLKHVFEFLKNMLHWRTQLKYVDFLEK